MIDLSVELAGLHLKNPIVVASGDIGCNLGQIKEAEYYLSILRLVSEMI